MAHEEYLIRDVMSAPVVTIAASAALVDATVLLRGNSIRHLPVLDGQNSSAFSRTATFSAALLLA